MRTVTGSLKAPLRMTFPLTSAVAPGLTSTAAAPQGDLRRADQVQRDGGDRDRLLARGELPLGLQDDRHRAERGLERGVDRDGGLDRLLGDRGRRHRQARRQRERRDRKRAVGPLGAIGLDGDRRTEPVSDLDRFRRCFERHGRGQRRCRRQPSLGQRRSWAGSTAGRRPASWSPRPRSARRAPCLGPRASGAAGQMRPSAWRRSTARRRSGPARSSRDERPGRPGDRPRPA